MTEKAPVPEMPPRKKLGHKEQIAFVRPVTYQDGRAKDLEAFQFYNGVLDFTVLKSKCLDISDMRFRGINMGFLARSGLMAPQPFDCDNDADPQAGLMGGFLFTCGLSNAGIRCEEGGIRYPFHGEIRSAPAEYCRADFDFDSGRLYVEGTVKEATLQGRHLTLRRRIETSYMESGLTLTDEIVNEGYRPEPLLLIYHINFGWPLLDESTRVSLPTDTPRPERMGAPVDNCEEVVIPHDPIADENGVVTCRVENESRALGAVLRFRKAELPVLGEWRSEASGDYVTGLEPGLCGVEGRAELLRQGRARILQPGEKLTTHLSIEFYNLP